MYGGSARGGKSDALLMAALQYVDAPNYHALILRRTFADLALPDAIMERAKQWLFPTDAKWSNETKTFTFPSGATLTFGYLEHEDTKYRYQGTTLQFVGFDELTQFTESQYTYLFSRLSRLEGHNVPLRMRSATNPGGAGHDWVKQRFINHRNNNRRFFVPAKLQDNPHVDRNEYRNSLSHLDIVTRARLEDGDWDVNESGGIFKREWFKFADSIPSKEEIEESVRYWDLAATEPGESNKDPDYTVGLKMLRLKGGKLLITDVIRIRKTSGEVEKAVKAAAELDGRNTTIYIEQEGGSAGKSVIEQYQTRVLFGYTMRGNKPTGNKLDRARPVSAYAEGGHISLLRAAWNEAFLQEVNSFTGDNKLHDDQVDTLSGAYDALANNSKTELIPSPDWFNDPLLGQNF